MKGFIELTDLESKAKVCIPTKIILAVLSESDGNVFIETSCDDKGVSSGIAVIESYDEVKTKIKQSEV